MSYKNPIPRLDEIDKEGILDVGQGIDVGQGNCQFCGKTNVIVTSTSVTDPYCKGCLEMVVEECEDAIKKIDMYTGKINSRKAKKKKEINKEEMKKLKIEKDEAIKGLMQEKYY